MATKLKDFTWVNKLVQSWHTEYRHEKCLKQHHVQSLITYLDNNSTKKRGPAFTSFRSDLIDASLNIKPIIYNRVVATIFSLANPSLKLR